MMNFVEQQIGNAEKQLQNMAGRANLDALAIPTSPRTGCMIASNVQGITGQPTVYGNTQTGYRADLRYGADVRPVMNCHQCKTNKKIEELVFCGHVSIDAKGYSTTCTKRYCRTCLWNWYMEQAPQNDPETEPMWNIWRCPSCRKLCCCHRCRTFGKIQRGLDMTDLLEQAGALSPARCLARSLSEAPCSMAIPRDVPAPQMPTVMGSPSYYPETIHVSRKRKGSSRKRSRKKSR
jgi:hypothetical protein